MRSQRRGLGGMVYFGAKLPPLLSEYEANAFTAAIERIRAGKPQHGKKIVLQELRQWPQFTAHVGVKVSTR